ncbi:cytochrome c peroxidase [Psychroflexus halocasei]|uniref:Cytochrome c peroxidase n=2 Tax=Psychroflexus halocasei TaxID=908615 RepID=A0A1H3VL61_9FLAO|nr:cytochrome c peroxidase [Psychroflexus halocasei]
MSSSGQIACASCHDPNTGWADGKRVAFGHDRSPGSRNTMSIINIGHMDTIFWDGRAANLAEQAKAAVQNPIEMNHGIDEAVKTIQNIEGYKAYFEEVYGENQITEDNIFDAIIAFERTIVSRKSRFDKFISGDSTKLTNQEVEGLHLFRTKARCINCHNSPLFTDQQFHNLGLSYYGREEFEDLGRYYVTQKAEDVGKFKTPSLRELKHTAPYMHNGLFPHLEGLLNMYNAGMATLVPSKEQENDSLFPTKSNLLKELDLNQDELASLEAFLNSLSSTIYRERPPKKLPQ